MKKYLLAALLLFSLFFPGKSQNIVQTIRGKVIDADVHFPLIGVSVVLLTSEDKIKGTITDVKGNYQLEGVPVGRHRLKFSSVGYQDVILHNIMVNSAKETILNVSLPASLTALKGVTVTAQENGEASNEMAMVSARSFTIEETNRYAGSRGDPARMASNFAGVQGADDSRNDIVIRGNSPQAVLWQLEGINIPNPNHFAIPGTGGGPVSILNNKTLANSDFYTGAFPAEFGNSIAGVFDLKLRNGNNQQHEFSGQLGFLGTELSGEGPISKAKGSSYLFTYRYATLSLFSGLGIDIGTASVPAYQDASFRVNFPLNKGGSWAVFGIGGTSNVDMLISDQKKPERNIFGANDRDQYFKSRMGILGASFEKPLSRKIFLKAAMAASGERQDSYHEYIYRRVGVDGNYIVDSLVALLDYTFSQEKYAAVVKVDAKINGRNTLQAGFNNDFYYFHFTDSVREINEGSSDYFEFRKRWDSHDQAWLLQPYIQWKHQFSDQIYFTAGLHSQYFSLNNSFSPAEPRLGLNWFFGNGQSLSLGFGLHSQLQPTYMYFYAPEGKLYNKDIDFTKSTHYVLSYNRPLGKSMRFKAETYYQKLFEVPVEQNPSSFSLVNTGAGFTRFFPGPLVNEGTGKNYGIEFTLEKFFSKGYFFMVTTSLFESRYKGSDGVERDTDFNGNYIVNGLFTKEFALNENASLALGTKITTSGGRRYGRVDEEASKEEKEVVFADEDRNSKQFAPYFRADLKINYKVNRPKVMHEIALDLVNLLDTKNILKLTYAPDPLNPERNSVRKEYQLGFLPIFYYRVDF